LVSLEETTHALDLVIARPTTAPSGAGRLIHAEKGSHVHAAMAQPRSHAIAAFDSSPDSAGLALRMLARSRLERQATEPRCSTVLAGATGNDPTSVSTADPLDLFGYAHCTISAPPPYCGGPFQRLGTRPTAFASAVAVDPKDTGGLTAIWTSSMRFIGVRPDAAALQSLLDGYGATAFADPAHADSEGGVIAHTTRLFLVDNRGVLRAHYPFDTPAVDLLADVRFCGMVEAPASCRQRALPSF
jgi:hypothetical protein